MNKTDKPEGLSIEQLEGGAVAEMVAGGIQQALDNIGDANTDPEAVRKVTLELSFKPTKKRDFMVITAKTSCKLVGPRPIEGSAYLAKVAGKMYASERDQRQAEIEYEGSKPEGDAADLIV